MRNAAFELEVECDDDDDAMIAGAAPCRFRIGTRAVEVATVVDRWPAIDHVYVRLVGADGAAYVLRHDLVRHSWQLALYRHGRLGDGRGGLPSAGDRTAVAH